MIKLLIICYIIIVILQIIITKYSSLDLSENVVKLNKKIKYNLEHKDELLKKFSTEVVTIANKINSGEMNFDEWQLYFTKLPGYEIDGNKYYFSIWEYLDKKPNEEYVILHYGDPNYVGLTFTDLEAEMKEILINSKNTITPNVNKYSFSVSKIGGANGFVYNWVDPLSLQSVKKQNVNSLWKDKTGRTGYVSIGIDLENLSQTDSYKYYKHVTNLKLFFSSIITIIIAIVINNLNATKYSNIRAFLFLFISNIYIFIFLNSYENESTLENEKLKMTRITSSILSLSFLSGVNIYILKSLFENKKNFFQETAFIFGLSIVLILMSIYKYKNANDMSNLITHRVSSQLTFNLAVLFNMFILINFIFYSLSIKNLVNI
jgi:hypothetical protein